MEKNNKKQLLAEIGRFLLVGGIATIVDYVLFYLFNLVVLKSLNGSLNLVISTFIGFTAGLIVNWVFSATFVYRYNKMTTKRQFLLYLLLCLAGLGLTELGMILASPTYDKLYLDIIVKFDFWKLFFKCFMTVVVLVLNYLGRKFLIFKKDKVNENE